MLDKTERRRIISFIRKQFYYSDTYKIVVKNARYFPGVHKCEGCGLFICKNEESMQSLIEITSDFNLIALLSDNYAIDKIAVDHIDPVGSVTNLEHAAERIFCDESNLMVLCGFCHHSKSMVDAQELKEKKSLLQRIEEGEL